MQPTKSLMVKDKLQKLIDEKFIEAIDYPEWGSNPLIVPNPNGRIHICIYFKDVN